MKWLPIESVPATATGESPFQSMRALIYGANCGVCSGTVYRYGKNPPSAHADHIFCPGQDPIEALKITHWMPWPEPPQ